MKFSAVALLAAAAGASANYSGNATVVTEVVTALTTYCPSPTTVVVNSKTYTITQATTLTITDCPCTVVKPVKPTSAVVCNTCTGGYSNKTMATRLPSGGNTALPTGTVNPTSVPTAGAGKAAALSGAGLAGIVGLAAYVL